MPSETNNNNIDALSQPLLIPPTPNESDTSDSTIENNKNDANRNRNSNNNNNRSDDDDEEELVSKGETQEKSFRDICFVIAFGLHVFIIVILGLSLGAPALARETNTGKDNNDNDLNYEYKGFLKLSLSVSCISFIFSIVSVCVMICSPTKLIQLSLYASIVGSLTLAVLAFVYHWIFSGMCFLLICLPTTMYTYFVWNGVRMKFSACNLYIGLKAVRNNVGVVLFSFGAVVLVMVYTLFWMMALIGVYDKSAKCDENDCEERPDLLAIVFVFLAYFWTQQVLQNTVNVAVASMVGKWWFNPESSSSVCSTAMQGSILNAMAYSFGSICYGSLLSAITTRLQQLNEIARPLTSYNNDYVNNDDGDSSTSNNTNCLLRCTCNCLHSIVEYIYTYFNEFGYVYVGVYGYGYRDASKRVMQLFRNRGWEVIIADDLLSNSLSLVIIMNASLCSLIGLAFTDRDDWFYDTENVRYPGMMLAFCIGLVISSIILIVIESAVNTVIVLFAESPSEFSSNHPELSSKMVEIWSLAYPDL